MPRLPCRVLIAFLLTAAASANAQTIGAPVYLSQPGTVSSTLLAAPTNPSYVWGTSIWYWGGSTLADSSVTALSLASSAIGSTVTSAASIPSQNGAPLVFTMGYVMKSDLPTNGSQPTTDIPNYFVTTGFGSTNNVPAGAQPTAAVLFGPDNTAQIGFAPIGTTVASFADFPIRIAVTNVFGSSGGGVGNVPEPQTWVLTLAGLLGAGLLRRRKREGHSTAGAWS
jgi:hypothetical protein